MAEGRARGGGWTYLMLATLAVAVFILVNRASSPPSDAPAAASMPRPTPSTSAVPHRSRVVIATQPLVRTRLARRPADAPARHCGSDGCCPADVRIFGTQADITRVIASFQRRGFAYAAPPLVAPVSGDPRTSGTYLRWLGERVDDAGAWGLVNVAKGTLEGHPHWTTVFAVSRARCQTQ